MELSELLKNTETLFKNVTTAATAVNKNFTDIKIVAASKTVPVETINMLTNCGIFAAGENRANEFLEKSELLDERIEYHFIGALQTNKVKYIIKKAKLIQSVDRESLLNEINRQAEKINKVQNILIEVNIGGEENKSGVSTDNLDALIKFAQSKKNISLQGLMAVPPIGADKKLYSQMKQLFDNYKSSINSFKYLSMGMSNDYVLAINSGANMIRVGSTLFGQRNYADINKA